MGDAADSGSTVDTGLEDVVRPLHAYVRREIDAATAIGRVCTQLVERGAEFSALLTREARGEQVIAGTVDERQTAVLQHAVALAAGRRRLLTPDIDPELFAGVDADFVVVEPLTTRSGIHLGALTAAGAMDRREDVLGLLPMAGRVCGEIGLELLLGILLGRKLHAFNNLLSILTSNLEYVTGAITMTGGPRADEREQLVTAAGFAAEGARTLIKAAADLRESLPLGEPSRREPRPRST